jgi:hypothetical protein
VRVSRIILQGIIKYILSVKIPTASGKSQSIFIKPSMMIEDVLAGDVFSGMEGDLKVKL